MSLLPKTPAINDWLRTATLQLADIGINSAKLDSEIILAHTLKKPRTYLHAHGDEILDERSYEIAQARLDLRLDRIPVAYIIGHKEFYGRQFRVTPATLIPRPESEAMITLLASKLRKQPLLPSHTRRLVDVGTGSGCLGITAKLEHPELDVTLIDISRHALNVAQSNAHKLGAEVTILPGDLLATYPFQADYVLANLPYVNPEWERSPETDHEPSLALFADADGLALIARLLPQAARTLHLGGLLILEADPEQHPLIVQAARPLGLQLIKTDGYGLLFQLGVSAR